MATYQIKSPNLHISIASNDDNDRQRVLITDHAQHPRALKVLQGPLNSIPEAIKAVAYDLVDQMIGNGDIDVDQAELIGIDYGIERCQIEALFAQHEAVKELANQG